MTVRLFIQLRWVSCLLRCSGYRPYMNSEHTLFLQMVTDRVHGAAGRNDIIDQGDVPVVHWSPEGKCLLEVEFALCTPQLLLACG